MEQARREFLHKYSPGTLTEKEQIEKLLKEIEHKRIEFENLVCGENEIKDVYARYDFSHIRNTSDCFIMTAGEGCGHKECMRIAEEIECRREIIMWSLAGLCAVVCLVLAFPIFFFLKNKFSQAKKKINLRHKQHLGKHTLDDVFAAEKRK